MVFAQSIGPLDFIGKQVVRECCRGLSAATVRDERSRALLAPLGVVGRCRTHGGPGVPLRSAGTGDGAVGRAGARRGKRSARRRVRAPKAGFDEISRRVAEAVDRLAEVHGARVGSCRSAARRTPKRRRSSCASAARTRCCSRRRSSTSVAAILRRARAGDRHAAARADPRRAARRAVLGDPVRSEGRSGCATSRAIRSRRSGRPGGARRRTGRRSRSPTRLGGDRDELAAHRARRRAVRMRERAGAKLRASTAASPAEARRTARIEARSRSMSTKGIETDYRSTLNLPQTDFPMRADCQARAGARRVVEGAARLRAPPRAQRGATRPGSCTTGRRMPTARSTWARSSTAC